ncbi:ferritin-like domain-containing protein [Hazenella sp. IB182357]|uniref:Ferritin-like domain-containing protein n=1 Tax=Polycladospora coralii TaxID=2771432 RepID=A0A926N7Q9_9BACL|nr:ferritin-like domain-containing protein [Polycladospora coralii]MBD1371063.1 ferritin-like domain-containing protein [Polycladospora coralii]MBS7530002.1 ferritin-like domain-containing protein [Polycladospora coralii]
MDANKKQLLDGLNEDLAQELTAIHQYIYNAAVVTGLARLTLKDFFEAEASDEASHAQYLADKIATLGGEPVVNSYEVKRTRDVKEMLEVTLQAEIDTIKRYTERIQQAEACGEIELKIKLEDLIADETRHKEEMERLLQDSRL